MEDAEEDYNVWIIKSDESEEDLNWTKSEDAFQRFKELFDQNIQNQTDPIAIGMTYNLDVFYDVLDQPANPDVREFLYFNIATVFGCPEPSKILPGYEYIDPILFVSAQVWLWKKAPDDKIYWLPISVEEFQQQYLPQEIEIDT